MKKYLMLINGEWLEGDRFFPVRNPNNDDLIGTVPEASKADVDRAIESAQKAFGVMAEIPAHQRSDILLKTSQLIKEKAKELAETIASESAKAWKFASGEVARAAETFRFAAEEAKQIYGETIPMDASPTGVGRVGFYLRFPLGVIGAITPFNFPLNLVAHKVAPALAAGNTVVLKPASATPLSSLKLGEILMSAGLPPGALNIVMGPGSTVGEWLVTDPRPRMITFTGSPPVGAAIRDRVGMKKITLELGSNSAVILDEGTDPTGVIPRLLVGAFANAGQVCISIQRIYVHQKIAKEFTDKFIKGVKGLKVGDPLEKDTDVGPMIDEGEAKRAEDWLREALNQGAEILVGGKRKGTIFEPTVVTHVKPDMKIMCVEVFAPIVSIIPFTDFDDALDQVDASVYGLQAGIYTKDISKAFKAVKRLNVGGVIINDYPTYRVDHMPYGGVKLSGMGREGLKYAIEEMTEIKFVCFNLT